MKKPGSASLPHSNPPASRVIEVSAGLVFRDGKLLITQRHADSHLGGLWEFPGGKRKLDETFEQCLVRELREELGAGVSVGVMMEEITHAYPGKIVRLKFFFCRLIEGEPRPLGCAAVKWVSQAELAHHEFPAADAKLLKKLLANAEFWGAD
jgi:mutator protein MutT